MQSTKPSKEVMISSNSATMRHSEHSEIDQLETSSDAALSDNIQENVTSKNKETVTEHKEVNEANKNESIPQKKENQHEVYKTRNP